MNGPTADDFQAAGLYDPAAPGAADRLAMLEWFAGRGIPLDRMVRAAREGQLSSTAGDVLLDDQDATLSLRDAARRTGLPLEVVQRAWGSVGLDASDTDAPRLTEREAAVVGAVAIGVELFGVEPTLAFGRAVGTSLARIAEGAVAMFLTEIQADLEGRDAGEFALARANADAVESLLPVADMIRTLFLAQVRDAIHRFRQASATGAGRGVARLAIGFVDLVGFTALVQGMTEAEVRETISDFEARAYDVVASHGGWVVKLIGDEVMFAALRASNGVAIGRSLIDRFADAAVTPRGGITYGNVIVRGGDYYGNVVNLASRLADVAVPEEVLVDDAARASAEQEGVAVQFLPAGRRSVKGFAAPVNVWSVEAGRQP